MEKMLMVATHFWVKSKWHTWPGTSAASEPAATEPVELLRSAKFVLAGSDERLDVSCGTVKAGGSGNALLNNFPAGTCTVRVGAATTSVSVQEPRKVECTLVEGTLSCR